MKLKEKIIDSSTCNFLNRANQETINELKRITSFLPIHYGVPIRYWYIKNDKQNLQTCKMCSNEPKFHGISKGYSLYCSTKCRNEDTKFREEDRIKTRIESDSTNDNLVICEICKLGVLLIKPHLNNSHKDWTIDNYKEKFPNSKIVSDFQSKKISKRLSGENNPFHSKNSSKEERKKRSIFSLEYWKIRYPELSDEELKTKRNEFLKNIFKDRLIPSNNEYWISQGFSKEDSYSKVKERQTTFTLEKCIDKFGEVEGLKKFNERQKNWSKSLFENFEKYGDGRSIQSKWASSVIDFLCKELKINRPKKEKWISSKNSDLCFSYDFTYEDRIIEFNGDLWHANPKIYKKDFIIPKCNITAEQKWQIDDKKIKLAESHGYKILVIWESEYKEDPKKIIQKCIDFLNS